MKFYRFTLAFDGEPQEVGFLQGLSEVGLPDEVLIALYKPFDTKLKVPVLTVFQDENCVRGEFWFTEAGVRLFAQDIENILQAISPYNWQILCGVLDSSVRGSEDDAIDLMQDYLYQDEYQICWPRQVLAPTEFHEIESVFDILKEGKK